MRRRAKQCLEHDVAVHAHDLLSGLEGAVVVEAGEDAVGDLLDDQLFVCFPLFSLANRGVWDVFSYPPRSTWRAGTARR